MINTNDKESQNVLFAVGFSSFIFRNIVTRLRQKITPKIGIANQLKYKNKIITIFSLSPMYFADNINAVIGYAQKHQLPQLIWYPRSISPVKSNYKTNYFLRKQSLHMFLYLDYKLCF